MKRVKTFGEVLANGDDQVIVRKLLSEYVHADTQREIVNRYNEYANDYNERVAGEQRHGGQK